MKHFIWITLLSCFVAALSALATLRWQERARPAASTDPANDVNWLRRELRLTPGQTRAIEELNRAYRTELTPCSQQHCAARCNLSGLLFRPELTEADLAAAADKLAQAQVDAERATLNYFRKVHAVLNPGQKAQFEKLALNCVCKEHQAGQCGCAPKGAKAP